MSNPFETLGLPAAFGIDPARLQRRFIDLSAANHPDRFQDPLEQADAAERSAAINEAYHILKNPESRAAALLAVLDASGSDDKTLPPNLLMEMMEIREELEAAAANHDQPTLARLAAWARTERETLLDRVGYLLDEAAKTNDKSRTDKLKQARIDLNTLRYIQRMIEQMP